MRALLLSFVTLALASPVYSFAIPNSISLRERAPARNNKDLARNVRDHPPPSSPDRCDNTPGTKAGIPSLPKPQSQPRSVYRRVTSFKGAWCLAPTIVRVNISVTRTGVGFLIPALLTEAYNVVHDTILQLNDGIITPAGFSWTSTTTGLALNVVNTNGGQLGWSVLEAALMATYGAMASHVWGEALVTIFEGGREVAAGVIGVRAGS